jgi:hypothetical protein
VCFYDFGFSFDQQVYPLLVRLKQIKRLERQDQLCEQADDCHCYQIGYQGGPEQLNQLLRSQLKTSEVLSFELVVKNHHQMNLVHDSGFK